MLPAVLSHSLPRATDRADRTGNEPLCQGTAPHLSVDSSRPDHSVTSSTHWVSAVGRALDAEAPPGPGATGRAPRAPHQEELGPHTALSHHRFQLAVKVQRD